MKVVISQPMYFPWRGIFEQIKLADIFVHYDDVKMPQGRSFINRVQLKTPDGFDWMTIPLTRHGASSAPINTVETAPSRSWREDHLNLFHHNYSRAPYYKDAKILLEETLKTGGDRLADIAIRSMELCASYLGLKTKFILSSHLSIPGRSSEKLRDVVKHLGGTVYITGHGGKNYLNYGLFERAKIRVEFMDYKKTSYPQLWGDFNPYVSILDLIANTGSNAADYLDSGTCYWKEFLEVNEKHEE